jgi:hypothetical protein
VQLKRGNGNKRRSIQAIQEGAEEEEEEENNIDNLPKNYIQNILFTRYYMKTDGQ